MKWRSALRRGRFHSLLTFLPMNQKSIEVIDSTHCRCRKLELRQPLRRHHSRTVGLQPAATARDAALPRCPLLHAVPAVHPDPAHQGREREREEED